MFEYLGRTSSTMKSNKFHGSKETIAHGKSNLIFDENVCFGDVLFLGNEETKLKVRFCSVEGEFRFFNDLTLERSTSNKGSFDDGVQKYLFNNGNSMILKNQIKNKSSIQSNMQGQSIAMFGKNITQQLIRKRKKLIQEIFCHSVEFGLLFLFIFIAVLLRPSMESSNMKS